VVAAWIAANSAAFPAEVQEFLALHEPYLAAEQNVKKKLEAAVRELRRALGITPSSEKRRSVSTHDKLPVTGQATNDPVASIERLIARGKELADWHKEKRLDHQKRVKALKEKLAKMAAHNRNDPDSKLPLLEVPALDDFKRTDAEAAEHARAVDLFGDHLREGDGPDAAMISVNEALMPAGSVLELTERERVVAEIPPELAEARVLKSLDEERVRYDFAVSVTRIEISVEKKVELAPISWTPGLCGRRQSPWRRRRGGGRSPPSTRRRSFDSWRPAARASSRSPRSWG